MRDARPQESAHRVDVPAASLHRRVLALTACALYAAVFGAFYFFEVPGLGIGHFYYIPVALAALAGGTLIGGAAGLLAAGLYALGIVLTPRVPARDVLTDATVIRVITYSTVGALIGWFSAKHRFHLDRLRELAERDFLTGLLNTRVFDEALARRCFAGRPFVLVLGDLDDLKQVNDAHGHAEGNRLLRRVAEVLTNSVKAGDELARVGGDEFGVLTEGTVNDATELCARLRRTLAAEGMGISFGWASMPDDGVAPLELFRKADDRLFGAKLLSRNRRAVETPLTVAT